MNKDEFIKFCRKRAKEVGGILAPGLMFDIINGDINPKYVDLFVIKPQQQKPFKIMVGETLYKKFSKTCLDYIDKYE